MLTVFAVCYFIFTIRFFNRLKKETIFDKKVRIFHLLMIWIIPFVWALMLKALLTSTPGSYEVEKKSEPKPFSKGGGSMWTG